MPSGAGAIAPLFLNMLQGGMSAIPGMAQTALGAVDAGLQLLTMPLRLLRSDLGAVGIRNFVGAEANQFRREAQRNLDTSTQAGHGAFDAATDIVRRSQDDTRRAFDESREQYSGIRERAAQQGLHILRRGDELVNTTDRQMGEVVSAADEAAARLRGANQTNRQRLSQADRLALEQQQRVLQNNQMLANRFDQMYNSIGEQVRQARDDIALSVGTVSNRVAVGIHARSERDIEQVRRDLRNQGIPPAEIEHQVNMIRENRDRDVSLMLGENATRVAQLQAEAGLRGAATMAEASSIVGQLNLGLQSQALTAAQVAAGTKQQSALQEAQMAGAEAEMDTRAVERRSERATMAAQSRQISGQWAQQAFNFMTNTSLSVAGAISELNVEETETMNLLRGTEASYNIARGDMIRSDLAARNAIEEFRSNQVIASLYAGFQAIMGTPTQMPSISSYTASGLGMMTNALVSAPQWTRNRSGGGSRSGSFPGEGLGSAAILGGTNLIGAKWAGS